MPSIRSIACTALAFAMVLTTGCGRTTVTGVEPSRQALQAAPAHHAPPIDLTTAVQQGRKALVGQADWPLVAASLHNLKPNGSLADTYTTGWLLTYRKPGAGKPKFNFVVIDFNGDVFVHRSTRRFDGGLFYIDFNPNLENAGSDSLLARSPSLQPSQFPAARRAVAMALKSGIKPGDHYHVLYLATAEGPVLHVTSGAARDAIDHVTLDAGTGVRLVTASPVSTPGSTDAEADESWGQEDATP